jgi:uncharacterized protein
MLGDRRGQGPQRAHRNHGQCADRLSRCITPDRSWRRICYPRAVTSEQIEDRLVEALRPRAEVMEAYLFGSHATGRAQPHSDIDVAVYIDEARCSAGPYGYAAELTARLMSALGTNHVDLVLLNRAPPLLYHRVLRAGRRVLARDLRATTTREGYALSRYCDYVPQLAKIERAQHSAQRRSQ